MEPTSARTEIASQLEQLRARLVQDHPQLYRHWALYLQVLREQLQTAVDQACFRLAVEFYPERYSALKPSTRQELHQRLGHLVRRCCALLTVEQLAVLAQQTRRRQQRLALRQRRRWLASLQAQSLGASEHAEAQHSVPRHSATQHAVPQQPESQQPLGSVSLGLAPPISSAFLGGASGFAGLVANDAGEAEEPEAPSADEQEVMQALSQWLEQMPQGRNQLDHDGDEALLPQDPVALLAWIDDQETALARRLRNLSHGINVELVRLGLSSSLLPLRLLEAVAQGQVETQNAPLNLVRMALPMPQLGDINLPEALAVLLRCSDLESQIAPLRTCRTRLQQSRQEVRRMAQTHQRLQRRLQTLDAEQLWLHDHSTAHQSSPEATG